jgi:hypothetical protein
MDTPPQGSQHEDHLSEWTAGIGRRLQKKFPLFPPHLLIKLGTKYCGAVRRLGNERREETKELGKMIIPADRVEVLVNDVEKATQLLAEKHASLVAELTAKGKIRH